MSSRSKRNTTTNLPEDVDSNLPHDANRRSALKKILIGGALLGSIAVFGAGLARVSVIPQSFAQSSVIGYSNSPLQLPKSSGQPGTVYLGSGHSGISSIQLAVIAGILARTQPQIYITYSTTLDSEIQQILTKNHGVTFTSSKSVSQLISKFGPTACGSPARWIRYNTNYSSSTTAGQNDAIDQFNAVRTLCGVFSALPVPAGQSPPITATSTPLYDISAWGTGVSLYQQVWNLVSGSVTGSWLAINPPSGSSQRVQMTDYIVMSKAFSFQVPLVQFDSSRPSVQAQKNFAATILNAYPTPCVALGYVGIGQPGGGSNEIDFVSALSGGSSASNSTLSGSSPSAHGGFYYTGAQQTGNMSLQTAYAPLAGKSFPNPATAPAYNSAQKYITIIASQGDVLDWVQNNLLSYMLSCQAAAMPIGITMTQVAQTLCPATIEYYISSIMPTSGIVSSGSAGTGYNHASQLPNLSQFLATAAQYGINANMRDFFFIDGPGVNPSSSNYAIASQYIAGLNAGGITPRSCMWWSPTGIAPAIVSGTPCFFTALPISKTNLSTQSECNTAVANAISSAKSNFIVLILNTTFPTPTYLKNACQKSYNGVANVTPLTPGTFSNLFRTANGLTQI